MILDKSKTGKTNDIQMAQMDSTEGITFKVNTQPPN